MAATASLNKSPYVKEWMAQADPPREANTVKKMNGRSQLIFSNKTTHYFKEWTAARCFEKKYIVSTKMYYFKQILLAVAVPKSYCTPEEN